jgi:hypothetical protein
MAGLMLSLAVVVVSAAGLIAVVLAAARDQPRAAIKPYAVSAVTGVIVTTGSLLVVHPADQAVAGLAVFAASVLLATGGHPVRLADPKFFQEMDVEPPAALLTPHETRRVQRRFILYVLLLTPLIFLL